MKQKTTEELEKELQDNTRVFILMMKDGSANLLRDLNQRFGKISEELKRRRKNESS